MGARAARRLPLSVRLIRGMHARLLAGVRGRDRTPGEIRTSQNWVGGGGSTIETRGSSLLPRPNSADLLADLGTLRS